MWTLITNAAAEEAAEATAAAETVAETASVPDSWWTTAFKKLGEFPVWGWILMAVLLIGGVILYRNTKGSKKTVWSTKMISLGAICMALSCVLSMIRLYKLPQGGSITPASMLPMMLFAYIYGAGPGITLGALYGVLQFILDPWMLNVPQVLLDYPIAFGMVGLAGFFSGVKNQKAGLAVGVTVASVGRFIAAVASGVIFFADYAEGSGHGPMVYSILYNGSYMLPECIICVVVAVLAGPRLLKTLKQVK